MTGIPLWLHLEMDYGVMFGVPRSPQWPKVRDEQIELFPTCAVCGTKKALEVHHIKPFHQHPELELVLKNLITLCRVCHFFIGHLKDWSSSNPHVIEDAKHMAERFSQAA